MNPDPAPPSSRHHERSIPAHLLWRSVLGSAASWSGSGSSSRGLASVDSMANVRFAGGNDEGGQEPGSTGLMRCVASDKRMFHLPRSLRDRLDFTHTRRRHGPLGSSLDKGKGTRTSLDKNDALQLLPHPRIVNAVPPSSGQIAFSESTGISCMDLDGGRDESQPCDSPSRFLLVGSAGHDCSIALYDLSCFGSDACLYQRKSPSCASIHHADALARGKPPVSAVTHRPTARSLRLDRTSLENTINIGSLPSGHRQPVLGLKWYPADRGSFVSTSISGEILVWDAESFVPVFATTAHVYSGSSSASTEVRRSVAPLQCLDLPKSPSGCPHGRALLALGLGGGDGRSVIRLCDAFGGGSATHELLGHAGGVNALAWDPNHAFRLASGGEDGTVRLWDVRKGGRNACLGVLDKNIGYFDNAAETLMPPPSKRQRQTINRGRTAEGVESHDGPVTALAFASGRDELVSSALDGTSHLWDLRPDSCYVSSIAAMVGKAKKWDVERGGMDPAVACGGRLYPFIFGTDSQNPYQTKTKLRSRRNRASSLAIVQGGSRSTAMLFSASSVIDIRSKGQIAGYSLFGSHGREPGGQPDLILDGHLDDVTCLTPIVGAWDNLGVGCYKDVSNVRLLSAGRDGIILSWGIPPKSNSSEAMSHPDDDDRIVGSGSSIVSMLKRQRQHRLERLNRQYRNGLISGREWNEISNEGNGHALEDDSVDVDTW